MEELLGILGSSVMGKGSFVIISGEVGMGKTRLVHELLDHAGKMDVLTYRSNCRSEAPSSLLPFNEICSSIGQELDLGIDVQFQSIRVVNELIGLQPSNKTVGTNVKSIDIGKLEMLLRSLLAIVSKIKPLIIFIDDLQWADSPTINLIRSLSRDVRFQRTMIIGAMRDEDPVASEGQRISIDECIRSLKKEGLVKTLALSRFDYDDLRDLIEDRLHGRVDLNLLSAIGKESRGIPLLAVEYAQMILEDGDLIEKNGMWCLREGVRLNLPPKMIDVIDRRMEHLTCEELELLKVFAALGEPIEESILRKIFDDGHNESIMLIGYLCEKHDLLIEDRNRFCIKHDMIVRAINERMDIEDRRQST
jgi:predicted ATPase